jgi:hypothetical protein
MHIHIVRPYLALKGVPAHVGSAHDSKAIGNAPPLGRTSCCIDHYVVGSSNVETEELHLALHGAPV